MLLLAQLVLGLAQGPIFPVSAGVFEAWFSADKWSLVQGVQSMGLQLGAALAPLADRLADVGLRLAAGARLDDAAGARC